MGVERPFQVEGNARGEEEEDGLDLGSGEFARAWTTRGTRPDLETPECHPRNVMALAFLSFNVMW